MNIRVMRPEERKFCYAQSSEISIKTCLIGYLRADFDTDGNAFYSTWFDFKPSLKTVAFKTEFDAIINALRHDEQYEGLLKDRKSMHNYCIAHGEGAFAGNFTPEFGFRIDTTEFAYLLRCIPVKGDYNLYCHCYVQEWLDKYIESAKEGIRFVDTQYNELFRIADGDSVLVIPAEGEPRKHTCRYIDSYHLEMGNDIYHIMQLATLAAKATVKIIPLRASLPYFCFHHLEAGNGEVIRIEKGVRGYRVTEYGAANNAAAKAIAQSLNASIGVTPAQAEAMKAGSIFGWEVPAADPANYAEDGTPILRR